MTSASHPALAGLPDHAPREEEAGFPGGDRRLGGQLVIGAAAFEDVETPHGPIQLARLSLPAPAICDPLVPFLTGETDPGQVSRPGLFFDTETMGLGSPTIFLAGLAWVVDGRIEIEQIFARDHSRERALLARLGDRWREAGCVITFNGRSYDIPVARDRTVRHRLRPLGGVPDVDLLPRARRRWRSELPDCRLQTLEFRILGRARMGDVPGWEIPRRYLRAVHSGEGRLLEPVFRHNALDLVTMVELVPFLGADVDAASRSRPRRER